MYDDLQEIPTNGMMALTNRLIRWRAAADGADAAPLGYLHMLYAGSFHGEDAAARWRWLMRYDDFATLDEMDEIQNFSNQSYLLLNKVDPYWIEKMIERALPDTHDTWFDTRLSNLFTLRCHTRDHMSWFLHAVEVMVRLTVDHIAVGNWHRHLGFNVQATEDARQLAKLSDLIDFYMAYNDFVKTIDMTVTA